LIGDDANGPYGKARKVVGSVLRDRSQFVALHLDDFVLKRLKTLLLALKLENGAGASR
jgi:hypothetical protein